MLHDGRLGWRGIFLTMLHVRLLIGDRRFVLNKTVLLIIDVIVSFRAVDGALNFKVFDPILMMMMTVARLCFLIWQIRCRFSSGRTVLRLCLGKKNESFQLDDFSCWKAISHSWENYFCWLAHCLKTSQNFFHSEHFRLAGLFEYCLHAIRVQIRNAISSDSL